MRIEDKVGEHGNVDKLDGSVVVWDHRMTRACQTVTRLLLYSGCWYLSIQASAVQAGGPGLSRTAFISGALRELSVALCRGNASLCRLGAYVAPDIRVLRREPLAGPRCAVLPALA
jgi:hypothetical protein